mgnify:FL=1
MSEFETHHVTIETEDLIIQDVAGYFGFDVEVASLEPFSTGESRGEENIVSAELLYVLVGSKSVDRYLLIDMTSQKTVDDLESEIALKHAENLKEI